MNEGVKKIFIDMSEGNLEAPMYNDYANTVRLVLKNSIDERTAHRNKAENESINESINEALKIIPAATYFLQMPSLGMITVNSLTASDSVLIPVQAAYLPVKGLEQLIKTICRVKKHLNPEIKFEGILISMLNARTNYAKDIMELIREYYGSKVRIFENSIPMSVRAAEISAEGVSIYEHDPNGKVASAYQSLTEEVLADE